MPDANLLVASGEIDPSQPFTELRLEDGRVVLLQTSLLLASLQTNAPREDHDLGTNAAHVIPIVEEILEVSRRTVPTATVRLHKSVQTYETALDEPLAVRTFEIERMIFNRPVEFAPPIRHEGDTTIYPLVEEQLILTKQLILKEEVHVTERNSERRDTRTVTLRRERLDIEREPAPFSPKEA